MQLVILAGGEGKRIAPLGSRQPKSMFQVLGKPLIHHVLDMIKNSGVELQEIIVVVGPRDELIRDYLGDGSNFGSRIKYAIQPEPLGQANALLAARGQITESFLVLNANDLYDSTLIRRLADLGTQNSMNVALVGREVAEPAKFGIMSLNSKHKLIGVIEKPKRGTEPSNIAVVGLYYFSPKFWNALDSTPAGQTDDQYERAYQKLISPAGDDFVSYSGPYETYKYPWDLLAINDYLLSQLTESRIDPQAKVSPAAVVEGNVIVEANARILEYAVVRGPAYIGAGTIVGNHSLIRGGVSIGRNCVIGHATEVARSVIGDGTWFHKNFVGDSVISDNCSFGAGTITANLRFDEKPIEVRIGTERVPTGRKYFGVIMAEDCRTGCNAVLLPGTKVGPNAAVGPGVVLSQNLGAGKIALLAKDSYVIKDNPVDVQSISRSEQLKALKGE